MSITQERQISFSELSETLRTQGVTRGASVACLHRWRKRGELSASLIGGVWYTTEQHYKDFVTRRTLSRGVSVKQTAVVPELIAQLEKADW